MNALDYEADKELESVWDDFASDPDQWVAILTGTGERAFCAGNDLKEQARIGRRQFTPNGFGGLTSRFDCHKPIIAAVNGLAYGGGFELALACDLIIASPTANFSLPEPKVGLAATMGGVQRLPLMIGWWRAMSILLTGRVVTASEALSLGFITAVSETTDVLIEAKRWADQMIICSPTSLRTTKEMAAQYAMGESFRLGMMGTIPSPALERLRASADYLEGPIAFSEKRTPLWSGS